MPEARRSAFYGRRHGKRLRPNRQALIDDLLPRLRIDLTDAIQPATIFTPPASEVWLEIGFGAGEHLAAQAAAHPDIGMIGCEPFVNGIASLLARIEAAGLANIRIYDNDARLLLDALPDASIGRMFILFPDPWPKTRHHKRRIVNRDMLDGFARVLRDGGELRLATDDAEYGRWMLARATRHADFEWLARRPIDWRTRCDDWPATRYEKKALDQGRPPVFLRFARLARN